MEELWIMAPLAISIPWLFIWAGLDIILEHFEICKKMTKRFGWNEKKTGKWLHRINGVISLILAFPIFVLIYGITSRTGDG